MVESPRGYQESNPSSRDLMARFDMAQDRKDRSPEVRAYLENLRPQILKLQRELRLQTDEDIARLDRRDDLDMNEVDKLVGLINAFRKAWKENAVSPSEARKFRREMAVREAAPAWKEIVAAVDWNNSRATLQERWSAITAFAHAGEPKLAWGLYLDTWQQQPSAEIRTANDLLARTGIWEAYVSAGKNPPFNAAILADALHGSNPFSDQVVEKVIGAFARGGRHNEALSSADFILDRRRRVMTLLRIRPYMPSDLHEDLDSQLNEAANGNVPLIVLTRFARNDVEHALRIAGRNDVNRRGPKIAEAVAEGFAMCGDLGRAQQTLRDAGFDPTQRVEAVGRVAAAFLDRDDVLSAKEIMRSDNAAWMRIDELSRIIVGFVKWEEAELAVTLAETIVRGVRRIHSDFHPEHVAPREWDAARAILPVIRAFADAGLPTAGLIGVLDDLSSRNPKLTGQRYRNLLIEAKTDVAIRSFKRTALRFAPPDISNYFIWDRDAWEEAAADLLEPRKELANLLSYGKPLPA